MYLITGITGQDGIFLTNNILKKDPNAKIIGTSRNIDTKIFYKNLQHLNQKVSIDNVDIKNINLLDKKETLNFIETIKPKIIFNLSGPSSVYESLEDGSTSYEMITTIFDNLSNACIQSKNLANFFQASSSEMFNQKNSEALDENTKFNPSSPYAKAKHKIHLEVNNLRNKYEWNINSGIMFNHESEFRNNQYLFMKIINGAIRIKNGEKNNITIGSLNIVRDWSYAEDFAEAMYRITKHETGDDYVIGSGVGKSIKDLIEKIFEYFDLDWNLYIDINEDLLRAGDPSKVISNPNKILNKLGWKTETSFESLIEKCIKYKLNTKV